DNERDGEGFADPPVPGDEQPLPGEDNWLCARVHRTGPGVARDVEVVFSLSAPYHTVGGEAQFNDFKSVIIPTLDTDSRDVCVLWQIADDLAEAHTCIQVEVRRLLDDRDDSNNRA